jgi:hypothetical protein
MIFKSALHLKPAIPAVFGVLLPARVPAAASGQEANTPTVVVTPSSSIITTAQPLTVGVAVTGGSGVPAPTGTVTLTSGSYTSNPPVWSSSNNSTAFVGDSLTAGPGGNYYPSSALGNNWTYQVPWLTGQQIYMPNLAWNFGVPGQNTDYMLSTELPPLLAMNPRPSVVNILGGTNDVKEGISPATTLANLTSIVNQPMAAGITPILCRTR